MATLYLNEQGSTVRKEQNRLVIERDTQKLGEVHEFKIERVVVFGNVQLTTAVIGFLLERGIDTTFLSICGKLKGRLAPLETKNVSLRLRQYERTNDSAFATAMAKAFIDGKIANCRTALDRHQRNHPECRLDAEIAQLGNLLQRAQSIGSRDSLRGIEGQAASVHFDGLAKMFRRGVTFEKRTRRPPTDPVNSLLSFGYTLLYNEAISALAAIGCDPYLRSVYTQAVSVARASARACPVRCKALAAKPLLTRGLLTRVRKCRSVSTQSFRLCRWRWFDDDKLIRLCCVSSRMAALSAGIRSRIRL